MKIAKNRNNLIVFITGSILSGKTTMIKNFAFNSQYITIMIDDIVNDLYKKGNFGYNYIKNMINSSFVDNTAVNKNKLYKYCKTNSKELEKIQHYLFQFIKEDIMKIVLDNENKIILIECPCKNYIWRSFKLKLVIRLNVSYKNQLIRIKTRKLNSNINPSEYITYFNNLISNNFEKYVYNINTNNMSEIQTFLIIKEYIEKWSNH